MLTGSRLLALAVAAVFAPASAGGVPAGIPSLYVTYVTESCTFSLKNDAGAAVHKIVPGTYQVVIRTSEPLGDFDLSGRTDLMACKGFVRFRLTGPGISYSSTLDYGDEALEIHPEKFRAGGTYSVQDDNNVAGTKRSFTVATSGGVPVPGMLEATVSATGKLVLTHNKQAVSSLKQGKWTFSVDDESKSSGFTLQQLGESPVAVTTGSFFGFKTVTITLKPGRWYFYSPGGLKTSFVVRA